MILSVTERRTFRTCRGEWEWASLNRQGLENVMPNSNLLLGSLVHYTMADWISDPSYFVKHRLGIDGAVPGRFLDHWAVAEKDIRLRYESKFGSDMMDEELEAKYGKTVRDLGQAMLSNYVKFYEGYPLPKGWDVVQTEQTFVVDVPGTEHCERWREGGCPCVSCEWRHGNCENFGPHACQRSFHQIEGTFDAFVADPRGNIFVVDHKTYAKKPSDFELSEDDQFLAYTWIANQLNVGNVCGVLYNGLWKRTWEDLLDKSGNPRKSTSGQPYELGDLFYRTLLPRDQELEDFSRRLPVEINEMCNHPTIYLNPAWYSCPSCGFRDVCLAKRRGEEWQDMIFEGFKPREKTPAWRSA